MTVFGINFFFSGASLIFVLTIPPGTNKDKDLEMLEIEQDKSKQRGKRWQ